MLPVGLMIGKALVDKMARNGAAPMAQVARTSTATSSSQILESQSRRRALRNDRGNPFEKERLMHRLGGTSIRKTHEQVRKNTEMLLDALRNETWVAIYRYPGIRFAVLLARAKLVQTIASVLYLPYSTFQFSMGNADPSWYYTCATLAVFAPLMLAIFSRYLNRLIGVIAMNESNEYIRVGYLTFWGSRKNLYIEVSDVLPLAELGTKKEDKLVKFIWYSGSSFLYLPIKHAEILDERRAEILFGDLNIFDTYRKTE